MQKTTFSKKVVLNMFKPYNSSFYYNGLIGTNHNLKFDVYQDLFL